MSDMRDTNGVPDGILVGEDDDILDIIDDNDDQDLDAQNLDRQLIDSDELIDDAEGVGLIDDDIDLALDGRPELRDT